MLYDCIPDYVICQEYDLDKDMKDTLSQVVLQLEEHFLAVCIKSGQCSVLIDYTETVFQPRLVSEVMMLDKKGESDKSSQEASNTVQSDKEGIMFYR